MEKQTETTVKYTAQISLFDKLLAEMNKAGTKMTAK